MRDALGRKAVGEVEGGRPGEGEDRVKGGREVVEGCVCCEMESTTCTILGQRSSPVVNKNIHGYSTRTPVRHCWQSPSS